MKRLFKKIGDFFAKIKGLKPSVLNSIIVIYKALYILDTTLTYAISAGISAGLNVDAMLKISKYVTRITTMIGKVTDKLGINVIDSEFREEIEEIIDVPKTSRSFVNNKELTMTDIMNSYSDAFEKIDELIKQ